MNIKMVSVVVADDHVLVRQGIRTFLETQDDIVIVGEAGDAATAVSICAEKNPHVALVDLVMPGGGIAATRDILATSPSTRVVLLTSFDDGEQILAAVQAGALSCLLKDVDANVLADTIRKAALGEAVLHPRIAVHLLNALRGDAGAVDAELKSLSTREREVLVLISEAMTNQHIAETLNISEKTVKTHVSSILTKLGVSDRTQAAVYVWKRGLKKAG